MSKYIIDVPKTVGVLEAVGSVRYTYFDGIQVQTIVLKGDEIEELNSDYINEHFGDLQDTAYQRGLNDSWEAARKIAQQWEEDTDTEHRLVIDDSIRVTLDSMTASEAIAKLKAYEEKQKADDEIKVGDEVNWIGDCFIVTRIFQPRNMKEQCDGIDDDGCVYSDVLIDDLKKTGRHFAIDNILEEMKA